MRGQHTHPFPFQRIPHIAIAIIIPGKEQSARDAESDRRDTAQDIIVRVLVHLAICAHVEEAARGVVRARGEGIAVREELDSVDIAFVACEGLYCFAGTDVPDLGHGVACARDEDVGIRAEREASSRTSSEEKRLKEKTPADSPHDIPSVIIVLLNPNPILNVPEHTSHITGTSQNLPIIQEPAARQVSRMRRELSRNFNGSLPTPKVINRADVVETSTSYPVPRRRIRARHDPTTAQRHSMHLVCRVCVPDDQFPVLRGRDEVSLVTGPVHGVDLSEMAF